MAKPAPTDYEKAASNNGMLVMAGAENLLKAPNLLLNLYLRLMYLNGLTFLAISLSLILSSLLHSALL